MKLSVVVFQKESGEVQLFPTPLFLQYSQHYSLAKYFQCLISFFFGCGITWIQH